MPTHGLQLTTQQLDYLLAIEANTTWAGAAAEVGVTPSALSQGVAELERRLGVHLFERDGRRRVPSRDHPTVLRYAEATIAATRDLERWLVRRRHGQTGEVRLGLIDAAATHHFGNVLRSFRDEHEDVDLHLTVGPSSTLLAALGRAELDLVICVQPGVTPAGVDVTPLLDDPLAVLAPPGTAHGEDWGPWVTFPEGSHTRGIVADALRREARPFVVVAESHQPEVLREMVRLSIGWTVLPLAGLDRVEGLTIVQDHFASRRLVLAGRSGSSPDPVAAALGATIVDASTRSD